MVQVLVARVTSLSRMDLKFKCFPRQAAFVGTFEFQSQILKKMATGATNPFSSLADFFHFRSKNAN